MSVFFYRVCTAAAGAAAAAEATAGAALPDTRR